MKLTDLLDQIDRLDGKLLPDWKYNDRTGAVIANAYRKQGDKWSCLVAKDIPADCDGEFIALARTALPQLAKALRAVLEKSEIAHDVLRDRVVKPTEHDVGRSDMADDIQKAITDAMDGE